MSTFEYREETGHSQAIEADSWSAAVAEARQMLQDGDWNTDPDEPKTIYVSAWVLETAGDGDEIRSEQIEERIDPDAPQCESDEHTWKSPFVVLGGMEENPGVQGNAGGVIITEVCAHCGRYRVTDTWDQAVGGDGEPRESITYRQADDRSETWVAVRRVQRAQSLDDLLEALDEIDTDDETVRAMGLRMDDLPTFGGDEPDNTASVWSWDESRLLVGESDYDLEIVDRDEWEQE